MLLVSLTRRCVTSRGIRCLSQLQARDVILCPGQGSQYVGMIQSYDRSSKGIQELIESANDALQYDLVELCRDGPMERLSR